MLHTIPGVYHFTIVVVGITDAERELDELRISNEKERRVISDLKTQKTMLEGELGRLSEEIRFNTEQNLHGAMRKSEIEVQKCLSCISQDMDGIHTMVCPGESAGRKRRNESVSKRGHISKEESRRVPA